MALGESTPLSRSISRYAVAEVYEGGNDDYRGVLRIALRR
jgi:hypothetical protein